MARDLIKITIEDLATGKEYILIHPEVLPIPCGINEFKNIVNKQLDDIMMEWIQHFTMPDVIK